MLECIRCRHTAELRRLLIEGVDANGLAGEFLLRAARSGSVPMIRLLFDHGAVVPQNRAVQILGLTVSSSSPMALMEMIKQLDFSELQAALQDSDHAVIVIAGDVCVKAKKFLKAKLTLSKLAISVRRDDLLGDAARFAYDELGEPADDLWLGVVKRSGQCARILSDAFIPMSRRDHRAVESWLAEHVN